MYLPDRRIVLPHNIILELKRHSFSGSNPRSERCGLISGIEKVLDPTIYNCKFYNIAEKFYPIQNIAELKGETDLFQMNPVEQINAYKDINTNGKMAIACFHTHNYWEAIPSSIDAAKAEQVGEDWIWVIYGFKRFDFRSWFWNQQNKSFKEIETILSF